MRSVVPTLAASLVVAGCSSSMASFQALPADPPRTGQVPSAGGPMFENPGGMWMPSQLANQAEALRQAGFELPAATLADPTKAPLAAVVSLGGCSASFVSAEGLVVTNHHCVIRALQVNSTPERDMMKAGFVSSSRADERTAGPTQHMYVTRAFKDVTTEMREGLDEITDDLKRFEKIEDRQKAIVTRCEEGRPDIRCAVASYYEGASYILIEQLDIRDVRVVYAPPEAIGSFGGEVDNWRWPRHSGDFAFFRAYVGADGKPADYSKDNVPYRPKHHLKLASKPLRPGDAVMVAGYPARTSRLSTAQEVQEAVEWTYPRRVQFCEEYIALLEKEAKADKEVAIKAEPLNRGLNNWLTNTRGMLDGLVKDGLAAKKKGLQDELSAFIAADAERTKKWGQAFEDMAAIQAERMKTRDGDAALWEATRLPGLLRAANSIVRMAEERPKKDEARDPGYQERNWKRHSQQLQSLDKTYDRKLEMALLELGVARELRLPENQRLGVATAVLGKQKATPENIAKAVEAIYSKTTLEKDETRQQLFSSGTVVSLKRSRDPLLALALALRPLLKAQEERDDRYEGAMAAKRPGYVDALRAFKGRDIAPDANSTLRVTYGTVRGYRPTPDAPVHAPFTRLGEVATKHTGKDPFDAPKPLLDAVKSSKFGDYVDSELGEVPVNFLSDLDITGGNSGSATLNGKGELVGLAFDGNYEAMASDWLFMPEVTRSIHVDLRYMLWVLDAVSGADGVLKELGVTPSAR